MPVFPESGIANTIAAVFFFFSGGIGGLVQMLQ